MKPKRKDVGILLRQKGKLEWVRQEVKFEGSIQDRFYVKNLPHEVQEPIRASVTVQLLAQVAREIG